MLITNRYRTARLILICGTLIALAFAPLGRDGDEGNHEEIPQCQEDEFLYPYPDFPDDPLACIHIDTIREGR